MAVAGDSFAVNIAKADKAAISPRDSDFSDNRDLSVQAR